MNSDDSHVTRRGINASMAAVRATQYLRVFFELVEPEGPFSMLEAILLERIDHWTTYWKDDKEHQRDGHTWVWNSYESWVQDNLRGLWKKRQVETALTRLCWLGVVVKGHFPRFRGDHTTWWRINDHRLAEVLREHGRTVADGTRNGLAENVLSIAKPSRNYRANVAQELPGPSAETARTITEEVPKTVSREVPVGTGTSRDVRDVPTGGRPRKDTLDDAQILGADAASSVNVRATARRARQFGPADPRANRAHGTAIARRQSREAVEARMALSDAWESSLDKPGGGERLLPWFADIVEQFSNRGRSELIYFLADYLREQAVRVRNPKPWLDSVVDRWLDKLAEDPGLSGDDLRLVGREMGTRWPT
jgi:hypothetical protein